MLNSIALHVSSSRCYVLVSMVNNMQTQVLLRKMCCAERTCDSVALDCPKMISISASH